VPIDASYLERILAMNRYRGCPEDISRAGLSLTLTFPFNRGFVRVNGTMIPAMMTVSSGSRKFAQPRPRPLSQCCAYAYGAHSRSVPC
jgi:hypothetical protein